MKSSRTRIALAAVAVIFSCLAAHAQTGTFVIITGPGTGAVLNATGGVVNNPGPTIGNLIPPNGGCPGTQFHYHGLLVGAIDPAPGGCGWGQINFPMLPGPTIGLPASVPAVPLRIRPANEIRTSETPVNLTPTTVAGTLAVRFDPSLAPFAPLPSTRTITAALLWNPGLQRIVGEDDARHAAKDVPRPSARRVVFRSGPPVLRRAAAPEPHPPSRAVAPGRSTPPAPGWESIEMTGPQAKPTPPPGPPHEL